MCKRSVAIVLMLIAPMGCASLGGKHNGTAPADTALGQTSASPAAPADYKHLPADALRAVAAEIEKQVAEGNREPTLTAVEALTVDTPAIRQAVRSRAARVELIRTLLDSGHAWERRNGRIWILRTAEYKKKSSSRQRDIDAIMVNGENENRWALYEGLLDANKLGRGGLSAIEEIFFEARVKQMTPGQKYEASNGDQAAIPATKP